jgi:hypothetical protein
LQKSEESACWISRTRDCPQRSLPVLRALNRWVGVYDYHDEFDRVEKLRDWYESDPDVEEVELPD